MASYIFINFKRCELSMGAFGLLKLLFLPLLFLIASNGVVIVFCMEGLHFLLNHGCIRLVLLMMIRGILRLWLAILILLVLLLMFLLRQLFLLFCLLFNETQVYYVPLMQLLSIDTRIATLNADFIV